MPLAGKVRSARLGIERHRVLVADLTAALLKSQTTSFNQGRLLEQRAAALTQELAEADSRLAHLKAMNTEVRATVGQLNTSLRSATPSSSGLHKSLQ